MKGSFGNEVKAASMFHQSELLRRATPLKNWGL